MHKYYVQSLSLTLVCLYSATFQGVGSEKQPPATDMYKLKWNDELATLAQRWADQCVWEHDKAYVCVKIPNWNRK